MAHISGTVLLQAPYGFVRLSRKTAVSSRGPPREVPSPVLYVRRRILLIMEVGN